MNMKKLWFRVAETNGAVTPLGVGVEDNCIIGWAGRDLEKTMEHVRELEAIGVPAPKTIPTLYPVSPLTLTQVSPVTCIGGDSCGEVEFIILRRGGQLYVGIGSDHTDRKLETVSVLKSKGVCEKPIGTVLWRYEDVQDHWDSLEMRAWQTVDGTEVLYQSGTAAAILPMEALLASAERAGFDLERTLLFSGTVPTVDGMRFGSDFRAEIRDPVLGRTLTLHYAVKIIPCE